MTKLLCKSVITHGSTNRPKDIYSFSRPHGYILDIGCGEGEKIEYLQQVKTTSEILGLDISKGVLINSHNRVCADAQYLPFRSNVFDSIICSEVLEHVPNPELAVKEIHRVLKHKGMAFFSTPILNLPLPSLIPIFRKISGSESASLEHLHVFSTNDLVKILSVYFLIADIKYLGYTTIFRRIKNQKFRDFRFIFDSKLSDVTLAYGILKYFASQIWIKVGKQ